MISICPVIASLLSYRGMVKRITELQNVCNNLGRIKNMLIIKSSNRIKKIEMYERLTEVESSELLQFSKNIETDNSAILIDQCNHLITLFNERNNKAQSDFLKKGKITAASGICIGIVIFILAI